MIYACFVCFSTACFHIIMYCKLELTHDLYLYITLFVNVVGRTMTYNCLHLRLWWIVLLFLIILYFYRYLCDGHVGETKIDDILMYAWINENVVLHYAITVWVLSVTYMYYTYWCIFHMLHLTVWST